MVKYTHVANATHQKIYVKVDEYANRKMWSENVGAGYGAVSFQKGYNEIPSEAEPGFTTIAPGNTFRFQVEKPIIFVLTDDTCISNGANPGSDQSVIITAGKTMKNTKHAKLWIGTDGVDHFPYRQ